MKAVGIFFLIITVLLTCLGLFLFFGFDAEPFRPQLEQSLSRTLKTPVQIKKVLIQRKLPLTLEIQDLKFLDQNEQSPWLRVERAEAKFGFYPFGSPHFFVTELFLENPDLKIKHLKDSSWNFLSSSASTPGRILPMLVRFSQAKLHYRDESALPAFELKLNLTNGSISPSLSGMRVIADAELVESELPAMGVQAVVDFGRQFIYLEVNEPSGLWNLVAELYYFSGDVRYKGKLSTRALEISKVLSRKAREHEYLSGLMTAQLEGFGEGLHPEQMARTLALSGAIDIREGVFHRLNFIRNILSTLTPLPEFSNILSTKLQEPARSLFANPDLPFEMLRAGVEMRRGNLALEDLLVSHDDYLIEGEGIWAIQDKNVDFRAKLVLQEEFSRLLALEAQEFIPLRNNKGRIPVPFKYRGILPGASVYSDLEYVATQFFQNQNQGQNPADSKSPVLSKFWESKKR